MEPIKKCPICASRKVRRIKGTVDFRIHGRVLHMPDVEFDQCSNCGERFFDHEASQKIDAAAAEVKRPRRKSAYVGQNGAAL